tara:strand:- start:859 stop:1215 length:357 start_codon:yes stop_codon:yes gene_type:complete
MSKKMGRPKKYNIDSKQVESLASFGCTNTEIASFFGCDESLLRKSYSEFLTKGRDAGKIRLRKAQWNRALGNKDSMGNWLNDGSVPMLIWLGKQILNQKDMPVDNEDDLCMGFEVSEI